MKSRPIHENLDTSFVNLSALIKYLRRRQFVGRIRLELSGYEADIHLTDEKQLKVREYDQIAGRVAEGEEALQRILIRSREPGGIVNVFKTISEAEAAQERKAETVPETKEPSPVILNKPPAVEVKPANGSGAPKIEVPANGKTHDHAAQSEESRPTPKPILPDVPFEFSNHVEARARQPELSGEDRELLLNLAGELLGTVDRSLAMAKLEFSSAFHKACAEIAGDYPFLKTLDYGKGKIYYADAQINPKFFVAGILETLRRILDKLAKSGKFDEVHRFAVQRILALLHQRRPFYDKFSITKPLEKILGV